jgi:hypothetical protein
MARSIQTQTLSTSLQTMGNNAIIKQGVLYEKNKNKKNSY